MDDKGGGRKAVGKEKAPQVLVAVLDKIFEEGDGFRKELTSLLTGIEDVTPFYLPQ